MTADDSTSGPTESRLIKPISARQFELYALSLEHGPNFEPPHVFAAYRIGRGGAAGCILIDPERQCFATLALRRRVDHVWVRVDEAGPFDTPEAALDHLSIAMRGGDPRIAGIDFIAGIRFDRVRDPEVGGDLSRAFPNGV
jgi:hypothetical protein